jgi:methylated-DNA-[protein]-cysteine S-methyltransferase
MTHTEHLLTFLVEHVPSPIGMLLLLTDDDDRVRVLEFDDHEFRFERSLRLHYGRDKTRLADRPAPSSARLALERYFAGDLTAIDSIEVATAGTPFQRTVWAALRAIPVGETRSYAGLAAAIGRPRAVRAVGLANGANPIAIIVPCHRVIGADASLTGYGGGLPRKRWLLVHEGAAKPRSHEGAAKPRSHEGAISPRSLVHPATAGFWA